MTSEPTKVHFRLGASAVSHLDHAQGGRFSAPSRVSYGFHTIYIWNFLDPVAFNTATSLSLLKYRDGVRSRSPVSLINSGSTKGLISSHFSETSKRTISDRTKL